MVASRIYRIITLLLILTSSWPLFSREHTNGLPASSQNPGSDSPTTNTEPIVLPTSLLLQFIETNEDLEHKKNALNEIFEAYKLTEGQTKELDKLLQRGSGFNETEILNQLKKLGIEIPKESLLAFRNKYSWVRGLNENQPSVDVSRPVLTEIQSPTETSLPFPQTPEGQRAYETALRNFGVDLDTDTLTGLKEVLKKMKDPTHRVEGERILRTLLNNDIVDQMLRREHIAFNDSVYLPSETEGEFGVLFSKEELKQELGTVGLDIDENGLKITNLELFKSALANEDKKSFLASLDLNGLYDPQRQDAIVLGEYVLLPPQHGKLPEVIPLSDILDLAQLKVAGLIDDEGKFKVPQSKEEIDKLRNALLEDASLREAISRQGYANADDLLLNLMHEEAFRLRSTPVHRDVPVAKDRKAHTELNHGTFYSRARDLADKEGKVAPEFTQFDGDTLDTDTKLKHLNLILNQRGWENFESALNAEKEIQTKNGHFTGSNQLGLLQWRAVLLAEKKRLEKEGRSLNSNDAQNLQTIDELISDEISELMATYREPFERRAERRQLELSLNRDGKGAFLKLFQEAQSGNVPQNLASYPAWVREPFQLLADLRNVEKVLKAQGKTLSPEQIASLRETEALILDQFQNAELNRSILNTDETAAYFRTLTQNGEIFSSQFNDLHRARTINNELSNVESQLAGIGGVLREAGQVSTWGIFDTEVYNQQRNSGRNPLTAAWNALSSENGAQTDFDQRITSIHQSVVRLEQAGLGKAQADSIRQITRQLTDSNTKLNHAAVDQYTQDVKVAFAQAGFMLATAGIGSYLAGTLRVAGATGRFALTQSAITGSATASGAGAASLTARTFVTQRLLPHLVQTGVGTGLGATVGGGMNALNQWAQMIDGWKLKPGDPQYDQRRTQFDFNELKRSIGQGALTGMTLAQSQVLSEAFGAYMSYQSGRDALTQFQNGDYAQFLTTTLISEGVVPGSLHLGNGTFRRFGETRRLSQLGTALGVDVNTNPTLALDQIKGMRAEILNPSRIGPISPADHSRLSLADSLVRLLEDRASPQRSIDKPANKAGDALHYLTEWLSNLGTSKPSATSKPLTERFGDWLSQFNPKDLFSFLKKPNPHSPTELIPWTRRQALSPETLETLATQHQEKIDGLLAQAETERQNGNGEAQGRLRKQAEDARVELEMLQYFRKLAEENPGQYEILAFSQKITGESRTVGELDLVIRQIGPHGTKNFIVEIKNTQRIDKDQIVKLKNDPQINSPNGQGEIADVIIYSPAFKPTVRANGKVTNHHVDRTINHLETEITTTPEQLKGYMDSFLNPNSNGVDPVQVKVDTGDKVLDSIREERINQDLAIAQSLRAQEPGKFYLTLGGSPTQLQAVLDEIAPGTSRNLPLSFRNEDNNVTPQNLTPELKAKLWAYFDRWLPSAQELNGRDLVIADFGMTGTSLISAGEVIRTYLKEKGRTEEVSLFVFGRNVNHIVENGRGRGFVTRSYSIPQFKDNFYAEGLGKGARPYPTFRFAMDPVPERGPVSPAYLKLQERTHELLEPYQDVLRPTPEMSQTQRNDVPEQFSEMVQKLEAGDYNAFSSLTPDQYLNTIPMGDDGHRFQAVASQRLKDPNLTPAERQTIAIALGNLSGRLPYQAEPLWKIYQSADANLRETIFESLERSTLKIDPFDGKKSNEFNDPNIHAIWNAHAQTSPENLVRVAERYDQDLNHQPQIITQIIALIRNSNAPAQLRRRALSTLNVIWKPDPKIDAVKNDVTQNRLVIPE